MSSEIGYTLMSSRGPGKLEEIKERISLGELELLVETVMTARSLSVFESLGFSRDPGCKFYEKVRSAGRELGAHEAIISDYQEKRGFLHTASVKVRFYQDNKFMERYLCR